MRIRLLVCLPIALLLVALAFASVSTWVSAIEVDEIVAAGTFGPRSRDATCDVLRHEIHALSHTVSPCAPSPECQGSPLLCPQALDVRIEREFERLRNALHEQCGIPRDLLDFAWEVSEHVDGTSDGAGRCELVHDGWESAVRGEARPSSYSF